jgi:hypothetical protein
MRRLARFLPAFLAALTAGAQDAELVPAEPLAAYRLGEAGLLVGGTLYRPGEEKALRELRRVPRPDPPAELPESLIAKHLERAATRGWARFAFLESDWVPAADLERMAARASRAFEFTAAWSGTRDDTPARYAVLKTRADYVALVHKLTDDDRVRREAAAFSSLSLAGGRVGYETDKNEVAATIVSDAVGDAVTRGMFAHKALKAGFQAHAAAFLTGHYEGYGTADTTDRRPDKGTLAGLMAGARAYASDPKREPLASLLRADVNAVTPVRRAAAFALADHLLRRYRDRLAALSAALDRLSFTEADKPKRNEGLVEALDAALKEALDKDLAAVEKEFIESVLATHALPEERVAELCGLAAEWGPAKADAFAKLAKAARERKIQWAADDRAWKSMKADLDRKLHSLKVDF